MTQHPLLESQLTLKDPRDGFRVHVSLENFFEFSFWMAEELEDLVANHRQSETKRRPLISQR